MLTNSNEHVVTLKNSREIRNGFRVLGYAVDLRSHEVSQEIIRQFQRDYNKCSDRFDHWENIEITSSLDGDTINALDRAIRWSKNRENAEGIPSARSWQSLCADLGPNLNPARVYAQLESPKETETNFVEVLSNGTGKLRNIYTSDAFRCNILSFERHGNVIFAVVEIPPQADLPDGRDESISCPCIFTR